MKIVNIFFFSKVNPSKICEIMPTIATQNKICLKVLKICWNVLVVVNQAVWFTHFFNHCSVGAKHYIPSANSYSICKILIHTCQVTCGFRRVSLGGLYNIVTVSILKNSNENVNKGWQWDTHWSHGWQKESCGFSCCSGDIAIKRHRGRSFIYILPVFLSYKHISCLFISALTTCWSKPHNTTFINSLPIGLILERAFVDKING